MRWGIALLSFLRYPQMPLTELAVRNARADGKPRKFFDAHGLFLLVTPQGGKLWRVKYRFGGKEKLLSLGPYPLIGLREARDARDEARRSLLSREDPGLVKASARQAALATSNNTFRQIADEYRAKLTREGRAAATLEKIEWYLTFVLPALGECGRDHFTHILDWWVFEHRTRMVKSR